MVTQTEPQGFLASPWVYDLSICNAAGVPLAGRPYHVDNDSAGGPGLPPGVFRFDWSADRVRVRFGEASTTAVNLSSGAQHWVPPAAYQSPQPTTDP